METIAEQAPLRINIPGGNSAGSAAAGFLEAMPDAEITVTVGMADGGSNTGKMREIFGGPASGDLQKVLGRVSGNGAGMFFGGENRFGSETTPDDVREENAEFLAAFSDNLTPDEEAIAAELLDDVVVMAEELEERTGLDGHTYGNLVMTSLARQLTTTEEPDFVAATNVASGWLAARARVIPAITTSANYVMYDRNDLEQPKLLVGEGVIDDYVVQDPNKVETWLEQGPIENAIYDTPAAIEFRLAARQEPPEPNPDAIAASRESKTVVHSGSTYTSIDQTIRSMGGVHSAQLGVVMNLTTEKSVPGLTASQHLRVVAEAAGRPIDFYIYNTPEGEDGLPEGVVPLHHDAEMTPAEIRAIPAMLAGAAEKPNPNDPIAHLRSKVITNMGAVASAIQAEILPQLAGAEAAA